VNKKIRECLIDLDGECVNASVEEAIKLGERATDVVLGPMSEAMREIGRLYEEGEYFIAELIEAAEIFKGVMKRLKPLLLEEARKGLGNSVERVKIAIGTVKGDVHDIGKSLVAVMLQAAGHEVLDLGVNVSPEKFVEAVKEWGAEVIGISALLTTTARNMKEVIEALKREGLRDKVFVMVGGAATDEEFAKKVGADAWGRNAVEAVKIVNDYVARRRGRSDDKG
jgi:dimethylamine corrinoid protein